MSLLAKTAGTRRVVIDQVTPAVAGGRHPFKRVLGDWITFTAHVFADSHDLLQVELRIRKVNTKRWQPLPLQALGNDVFEATYRSDDIGLFEYEIAGAIDPYGSWQEGFQKKHQEGLPLDLECRIGAELLKQAAQRAKAPHSKQLHTWAAQLADTSTDIEARIRLAYSRHVRDLARSYPDRNSESTSARALMLIERERAAFSSWYEYFPRSCVHDGRTHGTFKDAAQRLPQIREMGFNIVYLPPIHPIGHSFRKGKNNSLTPGPDDVGSPWAIGAKEGGHRTILPALGTLADFQRFIRKAEKHDLEVALDIAFQCAPDHPWVKEHPQWFRWRPDGSVQYAENPPKKYQDILPINFDSEDWENLWDALKSIFEYWIEQGVKIFRVDNPHTKSLNFWRWCILNLKAVHPEVIFLAEAFTRPKRKYYLAKSGFTQGYTYFTWRSNAADLRAYVEELTQSTVKDYFWPNFWPNTPDILHADLQTGNRAAFIGRYVLAATLSSNIGIYGPAYELLDHEPFPGKEENNHNEKYQLKAWQLDRPDNIRAEITRVNAIRNAHQAFQRTFNIRFIPCSNTHLIAYLKENFDKSDRFIVVVNMDWENKQIGSLDLSSQPLNLAPDSGLNLIDHFDPQQASYHWQGQSAYIELDPAVRPAHILQIL